MNVLEISGLKKRFGGLVVTDSVDLSLLPNELHAVIGPNGAGKSTLIAQIAGELRADAGSIRLQGVDVTNRSPRQRARMGLARSFQISNVFPSMSAEQNVTLSVQALAGHNFRFWRPASSIETIREPARQILARVGLGDCRAASASRMSHGERRQLELAMAIASQPKVLLLDEPMAGLGPEESAAMVALLRDLKKDYAIVLVEHDMDAVFSLADRITVLSGGRVLASGSPASIRNNAAVRAAYLGNEKSRDEGDPDRQVPRSSMVVSIQPPPKGITTAARLIGKIASDAAAGEFLALRNVDAGYGHFRVLFDVSIDVRKGEVITLLGRNGMGKSTLLKTMIGAIKPTRGALRFCERDVTQLPLYKIARLGIGLVPEGRRIFPSLTVEENLVATAVVRDGPTCWTLDRIYRLFPRLRERRGNMGNHLSGGEQQMLSIGRALMTNPSLLILDEATEGLAPLVRTEIWRVIDEIKATGQSIVVVDKDIDELSRIADRHYLIEKGRLIWSGDTRALSGDLDYVHRHMSI